MININAYPIIKEAQEGMASPIVSDLVAVGNCRRSGDIVTTLVADNNTYLEINGLHSTSFIGRTILCGRELMKITNVVQQSTTTYIYVERAKYGTIDCYENRLLDDCALEPNFMVRTVELFSNINSFEINGNGGNMSELFSFQVETGKLEIDVDDLEAFNSTNPTSTYLFKAKTTSIHIFRGFNGQRALVYTGFFDKMYESYGRGEGRKISINFYDKTGTYYNTAITDSFVFENSQVATLIATVLKIPTNMVYYSSGLTEGDFYFIKALYSKEYTAYKDLFQALVQHGIRLCYDELERVKIFSDLKALSVVPDLDVFIGETNILDIKRNSDSRYIRNKFTATYKKRQPLYDFIGNLNSKHVNFRYNLAVSNFTFLKGNDEYTPLDVTDTDLFSKTTIGNLVLLKDNLNGNEFYGKVMDKTPPSTTNILVGQFSKDSYLTSFGKYAHLQSQGYSSPRNFTLHYSSERLPEVANITLDYSSGEKSTKLKFALLPQVTGQDEVVKSWDLSFGSVADLTVGKYAGITTNVEGIYGTWNNTKLFYDRELDQFNNVNPPIYLLTNRITTPLGNSPTTLLQFDKFDNSNVQLKVDKSTDSDSDIYVEFKNTTTINPTDVVTVTPIARTLNNTLEVASLTGFNVGDVLVVQPQPSMNLFDQDTYNQTKDIRYIIINCTTEGSKHYITLSDNYPLAYENAFVFSAKKYPSTSIVYLQEMFIRGNPIIEEEIPINIINQQSIDTYDEIPYSFDAKFYDENGYKDLIDYFYNGFGAIGNTDRKYVYPIKIRDHWHVSKGDVIRFRDSIYTGVETTSLWYVLSASHKSKSQEYSLTVINLNDFNADGSWVKFDSKLKYQPSSEVFYEYNEADTGSAVLRESDDTFGEISASKIPRDVFRADILSYTNGILTFNNFNGTDLTNKKALLFSVGNAQNFIVQVGSEYLYVKTNSEDSVVILKRAMFESVEGVLDSSQTVTFYYITSVVNPEGTLISQDLYVGNDSNYMKFDSDTGEVDISTTGNIELANPSNRLFFDKDTNPTTNKSQILLAVDWKDNVTGEVKAVYDGVEFQIGSEVSDGYMRYDSSSGLVIRGTLILEDGSPVSNVVADVNKIYYQNSQPTTSLKKGDLWIDSDSNNKLYVYNGTTFILAQDYYTALTTAQNANALAQSKILSTYNDRNNTVVGNLNYNTATNEIERYNGSVWQPISNNSIELTTNVAVTSTLDLLYSTFIINPSSDITLTLPSCVNYNNKKIIIKNMSTFIITINTSNSELIDGSTSISLTNQYETVRLHSNSVQWIKI